MLSYSEKPTPRVLPARALLCTLIVSVGASYWLVPDQKELVERLMFDRQYSRLADIVRAQLGSMRGIDSTALKTLTPQQIDALTRLLRLTPREQLQAIFSKTRPMPYDQFAHAITLAAVRYVDVVQPQMAWDIIRESIAGIAPAQLMTLAEVLGQNALALGQPALAASIYERVAELPESTIAIATNMAQAYRWSSQPRIGAERLHLWLRQHQAQLAAADTERLSDLVATLALEGGRPSLAFDIMLDRLKSLPTDSALPEALVTRAADLAAQSGRNQDFTPWLARFVKTLPESQLSLAELHKLRSSNPKQAATYQQWASKLANFHDWSSAFDEAFSLHLRLAVVGQMTSLDRVLALSEYLGRDEDTAQMLLVVGSLPERPKLSLQLANLLAGLGDDVRSRPLFEAWVASHPNDAEAHYDYASLLMDMGEEDASTAAFAELVKRHPGHVPAVKKLAEGYIRSSQYRDAMNLYAKLAEADHDHATLENYALLAESLDDHQALFNAQALAIHHAKLPSTEAYLDLAESASYLADAEPALAELEKGIARLPESAALRVAVANLYLHRERSDKALAVLMHPSVKGNFAGMMLLLGQAYTVPDQQALLAFLGQDFEQRFDLSPTARLDLAVLTSLCGQTERGSRLFASVPETPAYRMLLAEARYETGALTETIRLVTSHLERSPRPLATDWIFLGEIYEELGRDADAQKAYDQSLILLTSDLRDGAPQTRAAPSTASDPITSVTRPAPSLTSEH